LARTNDFRGGYPAVVICDSFGNAAKELKGLDVTILLKHLPYSLGSVTLLFGHLLVLLDDLPAPLQVGTNLAFLGWLGSAIAWR
jgi:hypothetical protein